MKTWDFDEARQRLDDVVLRALAHEPQLVSCDGGRAVVVLSEDDYDRLVPPRDMIDFLQSSPLAEAIAAGELELPERRADFGRDIEL